MRCPVCRADNDAGPSCRRCRADLSLLFALEVQRQRLLVEAGAAARRCAWSETARLAEAAQALRRGDDARRFLAVAQLLQRDFAAAWASYREKLET